MRVKDLIEKLKQFDPDDYIGVELPDMDGTCIVPLIEVERDTSEYHRCKFILDYHYMP